MFYGQMWQFVNGMTGKNERSLRKTFLCKDDIRRKNQTNSFTSMYRCIKITSSVNFLSILLMETEETIEQLLFSSC